MAAGDAVQQIKDRLSIIDVVSPYVELHQAGKNLKGKSPFTAEKTPSFYVSPDRGMYYCFSSSQGGDIFTFIQAMEGVDFKGSLKILADKAGVELVPEDPKKRSERDTQYAVLEAATRYFESELGVHAAATRYLTDRGVRDETIKIWRIGFVPGPPEHGWRHTREALTAQRFSDAELVRAGLIKATEGKQPYDVFRDRVMFPISDASGRVVAFSGRVLTKDSDAPKYVNSPETELFNKSEILFGYDKAKQGIRKFDFSLIVEGQFDVVLAHQAGYTNTVAVSGTALTAHQVSLLQRLSNRVVLALDSDRAGIAAVKRAAELCLARGMDLKVAQLPDGKDPADIIKADVEQFKKLIGRATHVIEFLIDIIEATTTDERARKLRARDEVLPYILQMESKIDQEHFVGVLAERLSTTKDAIMLELARLEATEKKTPAATPEVASVEVQSTPVESNRREAVLSYLITILEIADAALAAKIVQAVENITSVSVGELKASLSTEQLSQLVFALEEQWEASTDQLRQEEIVDRLTELEKIEQQQKLRHLKGQLAVAEATHDSVAVGQHIEAIAVIQKSAAQPSIIGQLFT